MQNKGAQQQRTRLADGDQMGGVSGAQFQKFQHLAILVDLAFEILPMALTVDKQGNVLGAFLFYHCHAGQSVIS
jgi:hypothetical protein